MTVAVAGVVWHGNQAESLRLVESIARHCDCTFGVMGIRVSTCVPHKMLTEDQRALDGLLFMLHIRQRLLDEEEGVAPKS